MIVDMIFNVVFGLPYTLLVGLDVLDISISVPVDYMNILNDLVVGVGYVLPVKELLPLASAMMLLCLFKILWALIIRVKSFVPTMGA